MVSLAQFQTQWILSRDSHDHVTLIGSRRNRSVGRQGSGLSAIGITKKFGSLVALDNVSMTVRPGTMHALLGGNGAGKSTLVKCIMGYYLPDQGQISLADKPVTIRNPREALKLG